MTSSHHHKFTTKEIHYLRKQLLSFYDSSKRDLPWRRLASSITDDDQRSYSVWVSEVMLQQTQVVTVIDYYNKWIKKWPNLTALANATLEDVNEMWSGLGYYSRGRRLYEGAQKVLANGGKMPSTSKDLLKELPGVGKYTAGAIASIAFNEVTGVVDGNVIRVLSRLRMIGADSSSTAANELMWELANTVVDEKRPGDFNQAMMELGATVCTPKTPQCSKCPLQSLCRSQYKNSKHEKSIQSTISSASVKNNEVSCFIEATDIEDGVGCMYCLSEENKWDPSLGVMNYPRKAKKKPPKEEEYISLVVVNNEKLLLSRRPDKGLLAGLWEFPMFLTEENKNNHSDSIKNFLKDLNITEPPEPIYLGQVAHIFSHIHHKYNIYQVNISSLVTESQFDSHKHSWLTEVETLHAAISTSVKKILKVYQSNKKKKKKSTKRKSDTSRQKTLDSMFKKVPRR